MSDVNEPADPLEWIAAFSTRLGVEPPDQATIDALLDLAGVAAHASQRLAAPIATYLVGAPDWLREDALAEARQTLSPG